MPGVIANTATTADVVKSLDLEFVKNFQEEYDRFQQIIGMFPPDVYAAGTTLYQYTVSGSLNNSAYGTTVETTYALTEDEALVSGKTYYTRSGSGTTASPYVYAAVATASLNVSNIATYYERTDTVTALGSSSGTSYVEGDRIARSKYQVTRSAVDEVAFVPYAKQTSAQAILKGGFEKSILRTDRKAQQQLRSAIMTDFFTALGNGTTLADPTSGSWNLQQLLAYMQAALGDALETNNEETDDVVYFVNRQDAAAYLASATVTTQETFGMTYLENFLGVTNVLLTNKVSAGTAYATPVANIHAFGLDFGALGQAGLVYESGDLGLVGVHHKPDYDYGSAETYLVRGAKFIPEVTDFICKGSTTPVG